MENEHKERVALPRSLAHDRLLNSVLDYQKYKQNHEEKNNLEQGVADENSEPREDTKSFEPGM